MKEMFPSPPATCFKATKAVLFQPWKEVAIKKQTINYNVELSSVWNSIAESCKMGQEWENTALGKDC